PDRNAGALHDRHAGTDTERDGYAYGNHDRRFVMPANEVVLMRRRPRGLPGTGMFGQKSRSNAHIARICARKWAAIGDLRNLCETGYRNGLPDEPVLLVRKSSG